MTLCDGCGEPVVRLLAEADSAGGHRSRRLWGCTSCAKLTVTGWQPPSWGHAQRAAVEELDAALEAAWPAYR